MDVMYSAIFISYREELKLKSESVTAWIIIALRGYATYGDRILSTHKLNTMDVPEYLTYAPSIYARDLLKPGSCDKHPVLC